MVEGYVYAPDFNWFRLRADGLAPIWFADGNEVTLEQMIAMGQRQWDLWAERAEKKKRDREENDPA
jgi:hypothetical protein